MRHLEGKVAWVTGAGSGIGRAAAVALAHEGAKLVLTGRRRQLLEETAQTIESNGGVAVVESGDLTLAATAQRISKTIETQFGRLDILVNNAGTNIKNRNWRDLDSGGTDEVLRGNLSSVFYCVLAALPIMREQRDGLIINVSSWAGRFVGPLTGPSYIASKHAVVALSHSINCEECMNGIRSSVLCPGEVSTPILDSRPVPSTQEQRARMLQSEDMGELIRYVACLPRHVCMNEVLISPAWNRSYVSALEAAHVKS